MNLNDLGSTPLADAVDVNNLPEQFGGASTPPPPPGTYRFKLPKLTPDAFKKITTTEYGDRVQVTFNDDFPLTIVQTPPEAKDQFLNTPFRSRISNVPRRRGKGEDAPLASDWDYLNRALGLTERPKSNADFARTLIELSAKGATFQADIEWTWYSNPNRPARFDDGNGGSVEVDLLDDAGSPIPNPDKPGEHKKQPGSGRRFYQDRDVTKVEGSYPLYYTDPEDGAVIRAFPDLRRFEK